MGIKNNLISTAQEVYFDLQDLQNNNYLRGIKIEGFEEFENFQEFIEEQISKINYLENHLKQLFQLEEA